MIDLHMHTKYSDGTDDCVELLKRVQKNNLDMISITDHNTTEAYIELEKIDIKRYYSGTIIPGIELNTKVLNVPIELLGYGIDYKKMNELTKTVYLPSEERNKLELERLYEKCIKAGLLLDGNIVDKYNPNSGFASKFIHLEIIKHDENKKLIDEETWNDTKNFYRKYMSNPEGPLYVEMDDLVPDFETAANLIREAGGLVFIPHIFEYRENSRKILEYILKNYKFDGIECYYTTFSDEQTNELLRLCIERNLYVSGGSDYHGTNKPGIEVGIGKGNLKIENEVIQKWKNIFRTNLYM